MGMSRILVSCLGKNHPAKKGLTSEPTCFFKRFASSRASLEEGRPVFVTQTLRMCCFLPEEREPGPRGPPLNTNALQGADSSLNGLDLPNFILSIQANFVRLPFLASRFS